MWPPTHPAIGYLLYAGYARVGHDEPPSGVATVALLFGTVLPDVIDQPLYRFGPAPSGRVLGHSLPFVVLAIAFVWTFLRRSERTELAAAFVIGLASHPAADALWPLLYGVTDELGFLLWPITPSPPYQAVKPILTTDAATVTTRHVEYVLLVVGLLAWLRDGTPGVGSVLSLVGRMRS